MIVEGMYQMQMSCFCNNLQYYNCSCATIGGQTKNKEPALDISKSKFIPNYGYLKRKVFWFHKINFDISTLR